LTVEIQNKILRSLLPICSYCKKTRNSEGYWEQIEEYMINNLHAELTHGICPECMVKVEDEIRSLNIVLSAKEPGDGWRVSVRASAMIFALWLSVCASSAAVDQRQIIAEGDARWHSIASSGNLAATSVSYSANSSLAINWPTGNSTNSDFSNAGGFFISKDVRRTIFRNDFDGDGRTDAWTYDEQNGVWYFILSSEGNILHSASFGGPGALACPEDYDGDGKSDLCVFWRSQGFWQAVLSDSGASGIYYGPAGGLPASGDYDGDGYADFAVMMPETRLWVVLFSRQLYAAASFYFGEAGCLPAVADYDGDGLTDPAVYQEETGHWIVALSASQYKSVSFFLGGRGYTPVQGDYDGDLKSDPVVYGLDNGLWGGFFSASGYQSLSVQFGGSGAAPYTGDYDNDGMSDLAVLSPDQSKLYLLKSTEGPDVIPPK